MIKIRLPKDAEKILDQAAKRSGKSKAAVAREAIERHIDELEARYLPADDQNLRQTSNKHT